MLGENYYLFLDTSSSQVEVGVIRNKQWLSRKTSSEPALESLFSMVDECLAIADTSLKELEGVVFCSGPGSMLGARVTSVAIKTWSLLREKALDVYNYENLYWLALSFSKATSEKTFSICSFWKRDHWNVLNVENGEFDKIKVLTGENLSNLSGSLHYYKQRDNSPDPSVEYSFILNELETFPQFSEALCLLTKSDEPTIYTQQSTVYKKWEPSFHQVAKG